MTKRKRNADELSDRTEESRVSATLLSVEDQTAEKHTKERNHTIAIFAAPCLRCEKVRQHHLDTFP